MAPVLNGDAEDGFVWLDRAVDLSLKFAKGIYSRGMVHALAGRTAETRASLDLATTLSPIAPLFGLMRGMRGLSFVIDRDFDAATEWELHWTGSRSVCRATS